MKNAMKNLLKGAALASSLLLVAGCSSTPAPTPSSSSKSLSDIRAEEQPPANDLTVELPIGVMNCMQATAAHQDCTGPLKKAFVAYGDNIDTFVNSGKLGMFSNRSGENGVRYEDAVYAGLVACEYQVNGLGRERYLSYIPANLSISRLTEKAGLDKQAYIPAWKEAQVSLCPDATPPIK